MADEIPGANIITITLLDDGCWQAQLGSDTGGIRAWAENPIEAIQSVATLALKHWWPFDPTWQPPAKCSALNAYLDN